MTNLTIPASVSTIETGAFQSASKLTTVNIPVDSNLSLLDSWVFRGTQITNFYIPKSVTSFRSSCLEDTYYLKYIDVDKANTEYTTKDGVLMNKAETVILKYPTNKGLKYEVISGIKELNGVSFADANCQEVTLPNTLEIIGDYCFKGSKLLSIVIPDSVTTIKSYAFQGCRQLSEVTLSSNLETLPSNCFETCALKTITIPEKVTGIGSNCFSNNQDLTSIILPVNLTTLGSGAFVNCPKLVLSFPVEANLYINDQYLILDKENTSVKQYIGYESNAVISIPQTVKTIENSAFKFHENLNSVIFEGTSELIHIYAEAFYQCKNLASIDFPDSLITIGENAFNRCEKITAIRFGSHLATLDSVTFGNCIGLEEISMETSGINYIGKSCFHGCTSLHTVKFSGELTTIDTEAFCECTALLKISLPSKLVNINPYAFKNSGLQTVEFSSDSIITELPIRCFSDCHDLSAIVYPDSVTSIGNYAFYGCGFTNITLPNSIKNLSLNCFSFNQKLVNFTIQEESQLQEIGNSVFEGDYLLEEIECLGSNFVVDTGILLNQKRTRIIAFPPASPIKCLQIPSGVEVIGDSAFSGCKSLITVSIPEESIREICLRAFKDCENLKFINIPSTVQSIGIDAFSGCKNLLCSVPIEVKPELMEDLVKIAKFPTHALNKCILICRTANNTGRNFRLPFLNIMIIASICSY